MRSVLVANRGEIAVRVMRTVQDLGMRAIAVYSQADAEAPHVQMADDAVCIGPPPVGQSYLKVEAILDAARTTGADAIHPGYGFLSENAGFAKACMEAGITFIGPPADAIDAMGNKAEAKRLMIAADVPCVPGYEDEDQSEKAFLDAADRIGFPVMVKAAAGGGGRGMRLVDDPSKLPDALRLAKSEAESAFGSGELILEKAIIRPRHVEVQVFADSHGNCVHLGERDCSVQRRHQKVVEEAPCPVMTPQLREEMGKAAVDAAKAIDYRGAGTVEFLLGEDGEFYFLEMNTRLQVEHPVTEMITGLDLVALQLQVARGEPLGFSQEDVELDGHAIEVRLYAEDPAQDFMPSTGPIHLWDTPEFRSDIRVDDGIETGGEVSPYYDPMLAKIVAHGPTREIARRKLIDGLGKTALFGPQNNRDFLIACLEAQTFARGDATTAFIAETFGDGFETPPATSEECAMAAVLRLLALRDTAWQRASQVSPHLLNWSSKGVLKSSLDLTEGERRFAVTVENEGDVYRVESGDDIVEVALLGREENLVRLRVGGRIREVISLALGADIWLATEERILRFSDISGSDASAADAASDTVITAPMHGRIASVDVSVGDRVKKGQTVAVLEAMKMQHQLTAQIDTTVEAVHVAEDAQVGAGDVLIEFAEV